MYLPEGLRNEHCKHVLQRFETLVDRFRNAATVTAIGSLAFFVVFFIPFLKLGVTKSHLRELRQTVRADVESRKRELGKRIYEISQRRAELRDDEQMLSRIDACQQASAELQQLRQDITRDFTLPLEVPELKSLPAELTAAVPMAAAPWNVDWMSKRHLNRIAHYRVMLAILGRIAVHQQFLEERIFAPVLAEIDGASSLQIRHQAEEIRRSLERLQTHVRDEFEAPLKGPADVSSSDDAKPRDFGLWEPYGSDALDGQFAVLLTETFRDRLREDATKVTSNIESLVENAPWEAALAEAWESLGLEQAVLQEIQSIDLSDEANREVLRNLNLEGVTDSITSSTTELKTALDTSGVDVWKLAAGLVASFQPAETTEPARAAELAASVKADAKRRLEKEWSADLERRRAGIAADERRVEQTVQQQVDRLKTREEHLRNRLARAGEFFGGLPLSLEDAILLFPVLLAGGFLICCAQFREVARLREIYGELTRQQSPTADGLDLTSVLPFPLADADNRRLRRVATAVPFIFQIVALLLLLISNRGGIPSTPAMQPLDSPDTQTGLRDGAAAPPDEDSDGESPFDIAAADADELEAEADTASTNWAYLVAFLVSTFGMVWGAWYAGSSFWKAKQADLAVVPPDQSSSSS